MHTSQRGDSRAVWLLLVALVLARAVGSLVAS
jgi:hypothetical protein